MVSERPGRNAKHLKWKQTPRSTVHGTGKGCGTAYLQAKGEDVVMTKSDGARFIQQVMYVAMQRESSKHGDVEFVGEIEEGIVAISPMT